MILSRIGVILERLAKSVKRFSDKRCYENKGLGQERDSKIAHFVLISLWLYLLPMGVFAQDEQAAVIANKALEDIKRSITLSQERSQQLRDEVSKLQKDQSSLVQALIASVGEERALGVAIREREGRLKALLLKKTGMEQSLESRRAEFGDMLVILERLGLKPPPAILVEAGDALQSVRSSVLLGSIVLQLRERTQALNEALNELAMIEQSLKGEQHQLTQDVTAQREERQRLELLLAEKARLQQHSQQDLDALEEENKQLEQKAQSLSELVQELEKRSAKTASQARVQEPPQGQSQTQDTLDTDGLLTLKDNFPQLRGKLVLPVEGHRVQTFDQNFPGELYETAPDALISAPAEGLVRYAGHFRSYGKMLIMDVGKNYHLVLAGMGRLDVKAGQILLAGEPVGVMGNALVATKDNVGTIPTLYVELRKDGAPINPSSWWKR